MSKINNVIGIEVKRRLQDISDIKRESDESVKRSLEAKEKADKSTHKSDTTKKQLEEAIKNGDQVVEVQTLRVDPETGEVYNTAADRFEANQRKVNDRFSDIGDKDELLSNGNDLTKKIVSEFDDRGHNIRWGALMAAEDNGDWSRAIQTIYNNLNEGQTLIIPDGVFLISNLVFDKENIHLDFRGTFVQKADATGACVQIGKKTGRISNIKVRGVLKVERENVDWSIDSTGIHLINVYDSEITIDVKRFKRGLLLEATNGNGTVYNDISLMRMTDNKITIDFKAEEINETERGWVNENKFHGGHFGWTKSLVEKLDGESLEDAFNRLEVIHINITSKYMNNNVFFSPSLEGFAGKFIYCNGRGNAFYSPRMEGSAIYVNHGPESLYNDIIFPHIASTDFNDDNYRDEGSRNKILGYDFLILDSTFLSAGAYLADGNPERMSQYKEGMGLFDARSSRSSSDKLFRGRDVLNNETFYVTGIGDVSARMYKFNTGNYFDRNGTCVGHFPLAHNDYLNNSLKIAAIRDKSGPPNVSTGLQPGSAVLNTAESKIYFYFGGGIWKGVNLS